MNSDHSDLFVLVRAPLVGGGYSVGTGCPVTANRILTARHVVVPKDHARDATQPVEIWVRPGALPGMPAVDGWVKLTAHQELAWDGDPLDAIILAVEPAAGFGFANYLRVSERDPVSHESWESKAYPSVAASRSGDTVDRVLMALKGTCFSPIDGQFQLDNDAECQRLKAYGGASGAPVLFLSDGHIVGVITQAPSGFGGRQLRAVSALALRASAGFEKAIGEDRATDKRLDEIVADITRRLETQPTAVSQLMRTLKLSSGSPREVVDALYGPSRRQAFGAIRDAQIPLTRGGDRAGVAALSSLAKSLLPLLVDKPLADEIRRRCEVGGNPTGVRVVPINLPSCTPAMAEAAVKAAYGRQPAEFQDEIAEDKPVLGQRAIVPKGLGGSFQATELPIALFTHLKARFAGDLGYVDAVLADRPADGPYYLVLGPDVDPGVLGQIAADLGHLPILILSTLKAAEVTEIAQPLKQILERDRG